MKLLIVTGAVEPHLSTNENLIKKVTAELDERHEIRFLTLQSKPNNDLKSESIFEHQLYWIEEDNIPQIYNKVVFPFLAKVKDPKGFSDVIVAERGLATLRRIRKEYPFDAILSVSEPYAAMVISSKSKFAKRICFIMDPPECVIGERGTRFRNTSLGEILRQHDLILSTPFILRALDANQLSAYIKRSAAVGFPMINKQTRSRDYNLSLNKCRLLFCGWMCSSIRSPQYFLDIVSCLDERFEVTFMGRECETLRDRFPIETKASIITLPQQPYETALQAMADADVLINIGNSVPVHMPSKTLEYINTGKPMVNLYKLPDCPTLYYTKRYPLCLNLFEGEADKDKAAQAFIDFCLAKKGQTVDRAWIEREYADCTPQFIAHKILDFLEN